MRRDLLLLLTLGALLVACGKPQPAVNRVQPNVLDKDVLEGEWYFLQTVIDTPYSAPYTFVGEQGTTEKVTWEIQEEFLIARRAYEHIAGSEPDGIAGDTEVGAAIAMFAIEKHFDIRRTYNPVTGEEQNVIEENDRDRPWFEREFMRVDWSENLITNNDFLVSARLFDGIETESVAYAVPPGTDHPHQPKFCDADGDCVEYLSRGSDDREDFGAPTYFDIVNKMFVRPTTATIEGFGEIPTCFLVSQGHLDCAPGEITVRNSFLKVDEAGRDYQPFEYTGDRMERFGYFVTERAGYDEEYGPVEPARFRFANRHNLWQRSHVSPGLDDDGNLVLQRCVADEDCGEFGQGSECDLDWARANRQQNEDGAWVGACTIPYREREVRPIAYHLSANFPEDLVTDAEDVAREWNVAFVETVASLRENECLEYGGDAATCGAERMRADHQQMFVLCHNPVLDSDHEACGEPGTSAEIGDLRHSLLGWVAEPHASSPLGYGPSSADPETGEIIMGNAFIYGAGLETLQTFARDIIALLNDDVTEGDVTSGDVVDAWVERNREPRSLTTGRPADDHVTSIDGYNIDRVNAAMDFSWAEAFRGHGGLSRATGVRETMEAFDEARQRLLREGAFGSGSETGSARLQNLVGTDIERLLTGPEMRLAAGVDPALEPDAEEVLNRASPFRGMRTGRLNAIERAQRNMHQAGHCLLHADFADDGLLGLAREIQRRVDSGDGTIEWYGQTYQLRQDDGSIDYRSVRDMVRHPIFHGVTSHEIGHTIGLRHNFSGSFDALNYHPRYWELRDDGNMRPRALDPLTPAEIDGRIREYEYSTVMDYGNNFVVTDAQGLGHYDHAAVKMGYGDMVEVFTNAANVQDVNWWHFIQTAGWPVPLKLSAFTGDELSAYEYTDWPSVVGGIERMQQRADVPYESLEADSFLSSQGISDAVQDPMGRPTVPYFFCSDEQRDLGPDCYLYDAGADPYETVNSVIDNYWNYYIFNAYRRGRLGFSTESYAERIHGRYFNKLKYANQIYSLYRTVFDDVFGDQPGYDEFWTRPDGMGVYTAAVGSAFELFTRVITAPEPGNYLSATRGDGTEALLPGGNGFFVDTSVDGFEGRALETTWNFDDGYYWFDQLERAGYYYDKTLAIQVLVDPQTNFLGRDTAADVRRYQINYYSSFGPALTGFLRGLLGEDWQTVAPRVDGSDLVYPDPLELAEGGMEGTPVDPNASFSIQLMAATYGMAQIPETFDRTYFQQSRIWVRGGAEGIAPAEGVPTVTFTDPLTGLTYEAMSVVDERGRETAPGAQMLDHAQDLLDNEAHDELATYIDNLDVVRRLSWLFDYGS